MNTYNEKEIIALLQDPARQKEAFECIVNEYSEQLYWQIRRMVLSHEDANDLLQNTFIKAWTNLEYFRAEAKMSTWLYRIALNECLTFLNKQRATNQLSIDDADADMVNKLESDTYFNGDETQILFQKALLTLPEKQMNYMWEEYEITYNHAMKLRDENLTDLAYMKRQIQELKNEIRKLGTVNVNAIEDFKNISERYAFLKNQHDDLVEAEQTLMQIIDELDAAMRKQFAEQFLKIKEEFNTVFRQLFGGGKGTLELMEDEDILEAGIRIIAQPPGKKLQNMMQLSGGEKALTAISLLFAIQNLKPSPFCLLDEIEAALDDNNVTRFAQYLHKLTKNTQFIVITHRRGTMTAADRLYGITMQEKGVSTLVSVDLLEDKLDR